MKSKNQLNQDNITTESSDKDAMALRDWRPKIDAEVKATCAYHLGKYPKVQRLGITLDGAAAQCVAEYFPTYVKGLNDSLPSIGDQPVKVEKPTRPKGNKGDKPTNTKPIVADKVDHPIESDSSSAGEATEGGLDTKN